MIVRVYLVEGTLTFADDTAIFSLLQDGEIQQSALACIMKWFGEQYLKLMLVKQPSGKLPNLLNQQ